MAQDKLTDREILDAFKTLGLETDEQRARFQRLAGPARPSTEPDLQLFIRLESSTPTEEDAADA